MIRGRAYPRAARRLSAPRRTVTIIRLAGWTLAAGAACAPLLGSTLPSVDLPAERLAARAADAAPEALEAMPAGFGGGTKAAAAAVAADAAAQGWIVRARPWGDGARLMQGQRVPVLSAEAAPSAEARALLAAGLAGAASGEVAGRGKQLAQGALGRLEIARQRADPLTGGRHIWVDEVRDGLRIQGARTGVHLDAAGAVRRVERAGIAPYGWTPPAAARPLLTPRDALTALEQWSGVSPLRADAGWARSKPEDPAAELVWFPLDPWEVRLAWLLTVDTGRRGGMTYRCAVDAVTGEPLRVTQLTRDATPSWLVFPGESPRPGGASSMPPEPDLDPLGNTRRAIVATNGWDSASPDGWVADSTTQGNNVWGQADRLGTGDQLYRPVSADLVFEYPLSFSGWTADAYMDASVVNLFYWCNIAHDWLYRRGFDEAAGNFQVRNFGRGGRENDPVLAETLDGSGTNNAQFTPTPDGSPGRLEMFVWGSSGAYRDSSYDTTVILHEYAHGLSTRLAGGPDTVDVLEGKQSGGMGEGWSDWFALSMTAAAGADPHAPRAMAAYAGNNYSRGIRRYPYSSDLSVNPLTYRDLRVHQQIHQIGEVWCVALWDAWVAAVDCYGLDEGRRRMEELVVAGLAMTGAAPTFLDARDAILLADEMAWAGAHQRLLWSAFARRGIGQSARDGGSDASLLVTEAFDTPSVWAGFGEARFGQAAYGLQPDPVPVALEVRDGDRAGAGSVDAIVEVAATGDSETVSMAELGCASGVFTGALLLVEIDPDLGAVPDNGWLESVAAGELFLSYEDEQYGEGATTIVARATLDADPPVFDGLKSLEPGIRSLIARWDPATDATPPIRYLLYLWPDVEPMPGLPTMVVTNETVAVAGGLLDQAYAGLVRAEDALGNCEQNEVVHVAAPLMHGPAEAVVVSGAPDQGAPGAVMQIEFILADAYGHRVEDGPDASFHARLHGPAVWLDLAHPQLISPLGPQEWFVQTLQGRVVLHTMATGTGWIEVTSDDAVPSGLAVTSDALTHFIAVPSVWADLELLGGTDAAITGDDQVRSAVPLGFAFPYYGGAYTTVALSANGYASVGTTYQYGNHFSIPDTSPPNGYLAPFATDLLPVAGRSSVRYRTFGQAPDRRFIAQWSQIGHYDDRDASYSFQLLLGEDGSIEFQYGAMLDGALAYASGGDSTVGVESPSGTAGVEYAFDQPGAVVPWTGLRLVRARSASLFIGGMATPWPDTDADGLSDAAEALAGSDESQPDTDGDIMGDGIELVVCGTDPGDPLSRLGLRLTAIPQQPAVLLEWPGRVGRTYRVEAAALDAPADWLTLPGASDIPGEYPVTRWVDPVVAGSGRVYRVGVNW